MTVKYYGAKPPSISMTTSKYIVDLTKHLISMTVSRTMGQISELAVAVDDPGFALLAKVGEPLGAKIHTMNLDYIVDSMDVDAGGGSGGMTLNCRPRAVRDLKKRRGAYVMNNVSPTTWVEHEVHAVGGSFRGQSSPVRSRVARDVTSENSDEKPSSWTTIGRLAQELGFELYEDDGRFYFGKPSWLIKNIGRIKIDYTDGVRSRRPTTLPTMSASLDDPDSAEYSFSMGVEFAVDVTPGIRVDITNFPLRNGSYLLTNIDHPIYGSTGDLALTLKKPVDPEVVKA